jgi:hypothetical protein
MAVYSKYWQRSYNGPQKVEIWKCIVCPTHKIRTHESTVHIFSIVNSHTSELYRFFET